MCHLGFFQVFLVYDMVKEMVYLVLCAWAAEGTNNKYTLLQAGEMFQHLRVLAVLLEDQTPVPSTHIRLLITTCNSSSGEAMPPLTSISTALAYTYLPTDAPF